MLRDDAWISDIVVAIRKIRQYCAGTDRDAFDQNEILQDAVIRQLCIIGEAAAQISQGRRETMPEVPWSQIVGMRHMLVHQYFSVDLDRVWYVVERDLDSLEQAVTNSLRPDAQ